MLAKPPMEPLAGTYFVTDRLPPYFYKAVHEWTCQYCNTVNPIELPKCHHCGAPRKEQ